MGSNRSTKNVVPRYSAIYLKDLITSSTKGNFRPRLLNRIMALKNTALISVKYVNALTTVKASRADSTKTHVFSRRIDTFTILSPSAFKLKYRM